ncbi:hypothetical protein [Acinetobacter sp. ANC 4640]
MMPNNSSLEKPNTDNTIQDSLSTDLYDAYAIAYEQMADTAVMTAAILNEFKSLKEYLTKTYDVPDTCFNNLKRIITLSNTMIHDSVGFNLELKKQYRAELEEAHA